MKKTLFCCVLLASVWHQVALSENVAVIVNAANNYSLDQSMIAKIYLGKLKSWPDGSSILAIDQAESNPTHDKFYVDILKKNPVVVKTLWTQHIFSGEQLPPKIVDPDAEVKHLVRENKNAIGYINASSVDSTVKVITP